MHSMIIKRLGYVVASCIISLHSLAQNCEAQLMNLGFVDRHWTYLNPRLQLSCPLPMGWFLFDYRATPTRYLRIGSNYMLINVELSEMNSAAVFRMGDIRDFPLRTAPILLSIAELPDTGDLVTANEDRQANRSISLRLHFAKDQAEDSLLLKYYTFLLNKPADSSVIKDLKIGAIEFRSFVADFTNREGVPMHQLIAAKTLGCAQILCRIVYQTDADLEHAMEACKDWKLTP